MTGSPRNRAMQEDLPFDTGHRGGERLHCCGRVREFRVPSHGNIDVLHAEILDKRCLVEWHASRHLLRSPEIDDGGHALRAKIAQRTLCWLTADEDVVADAREFLLELTARIK